MHERKLEQRAAALLDIISDLRFEQQRREHALEDCRSDIARLQSRIDSLTVQVERYRTDWLHATDSSTYFRQAAQVERNRCIDLENILRNLGHHIDLPSPQQSQWDAEDLTYPSPPRRRAGPGHVSLAAEEDSAPVGRVPGYSCSQESQGAAMWRVISANAPGHESDDVQ